jgi:hypothetical protein
VAGGRRLVADFLAAFNAGDQEKLQALWAQTGQGWEWFSTDGPDPRIGNVARDRAGLGAYFARRHAQHEVFRLLSFQWNGTSGMLGNFEYTLDRRADDLRRTLYGGKGSAVCTSPPVTFGEWSMARHRPG